MDPNPEIPAKPAVPLPDVAKSPPPPSIPPPFIPPPTIPAPPPPVAAPAPATKVNLKPAVEESAEEAQPGDLAPFNTRVIAALIDVLVAAGVLIVAQFILPAILDRAAWLLYAGYLATRDSLPFLGGQSIGKKAMKLRAVTLDGQSLAGKWEPGLIRSGILIIPVMGVVELIVLLTRENGPERGRRLGDEWSKTKVIVEAAPVVES